MVFPSVPVYLDPPNWNQLQQHAHQPAAGSSRAASSGGEVPPPPGLAAPHPDGPVSSVSGVSRPASMAERARLAKIPQPEPAPNCPRCDSTNTKFCYFNNYSLSQPRHFCKTCRRYWTRGGALRNVPVGGGCRRNKRNKSGSGSSSKSTSGASSSRQAGASSTSSVAIPTAAGAMTSSGVPLQPQMPFLASLHPLPDYVVTPNLGLSFGRMQPFDGGDYQVSGTGGELENLRIHQPMQQLPFFGALETSPALAPAPVTGLFSLAGERGAMDGGSLMGQVPTKAPHTGLIRQPASVKMDDRNAQGLKFSGQYMGTQRNIDNFWNSAGSSSTGGSGGGGAGATGSGWATDLSGFGSSATGDLL